VTFPDCVQANVTRTNHIMWTMGNDFEYLYADSWFSQMDKLIHYVNKVIVAFALGYSSYKSLFDIVAIQYLIFFSQFCFRDISPIFFFFLLIFLL